MSEAHQFLNKLEAALKARCDLAEAYSRCSEDAAYFCRREIEEAKLTEQSLLDCIQQMIADGGKHEQR